MADGRLIRFDGASGLPVDELIAMAYTATRNGCQELLPYLGVTVKIPQILKGNKCRFGSVMVLRLSSPRVAKV